MFAWRAHITRYRRRLLPGEQWARYTFLVLLVLAAILRFWDLPHIPYTHDEISALVRIYPSLYETVQRGVAQQDTHPPGVQVFEWIWTRIFGMEEHGVKLPFILMGLLAIFFLYRTAILWTSATTAILLTALMATLQYTVMYGQIARPYAAGLFTTAWLADQLTRYVAFGGYRHLRGAFFAALLSAYVHHFSLMLAGIMVASMFFLIRPEQRKGYFFMCALVVLFYLPNLPIFLKQLGQGGLSEWLGPPDRFWFADYGMYIAHWSGPFALILGGLVLLSIILGIRHGMGSARAALLFSIWGLVPLAVGFAYSVWRAPVLQYSVVLFSFPYLALVLLMGLGRLPKTAALSLTALVTVISVYTLIHHRRHYEIFYTSKYEAIVRTGHGLLKELGPEQAAVLIDAPEDVIRFYMRLWDIPVHEFEYTQLRNTLSVPYVERELRSLAGRRIVYGQSNGSLAEQLPRIQHHFPYMLHRADHPEGQVFIFSDDTAHAQQQVVDRVLIAHATPTRQHGHWHVDPYVAVMDTSAIPAWDMNGRDFGVVLELLVDTVVQHPQDQFEVIAFLRVGEHVTEVNMVAQLFHEEEPLFYRDGRLNEMGAVEGPARLFVTMRPAYAGTRGAPLHLKTYIHNVGMGPVALERIQVWLRRANGVQYGIFGPLPGS